ncbi:hypothetical protein [Chromobacterium piscinae]|uniref:hypothetical protein n=1 Tax=Chromobacterium piscinae TaxID=686831 RepID=UPI003F8010CD
MKTLLALLLIGFMYTASPVAKAAFTMLGSTPTIGGASVVCMGIPTVVVSPLNDIAYAAPAGTMFPFPAILLRPDVFQYPPVLQLFIYAHECGHFNVGPDETAADCWAIKLGRNQGWFTAASFPLLIQALGNSPGNSTHLPGPYRLAALQQCFLAP